MKKSKLRIVISTVVAVNIIITSSLVASAKPTEILDSNSISVENNAGISDVVKVRGSFAAGDIITVYSSKDGYVLAETVLNNATSVVNLNISQLGKDPGTIYVKLRRSGLESGIEKSYKGEVTEKLDKSLATLEYNVSKSPSLKFKTVLEKTFIQVFNKRGELILVGEAKQSGPLELTLPKNINEDRVFVTFTLPNKYESDRVEVTANILESTKEVEESSVIIENNAMSPSIVTVKKLAQKDIVTIYDDEEKGGVIGKGTATNTGEAAITLKNKLVQKYIYVTITGENKLESNRIRVRVPDAQTSAPLNSYNVLVNNNTSKEDEVVVRGLMKDDEVYVYWNDYDKTPLIKQKSSKDGEVIIKFPSQIPENIKYLYVSVTRKNKFESSKIKIEVPEENDSFNISEYDIEVENNVGKPDTVTVSSVLKGDTIKVYKLENDEYKLIGSETVSNDGASVVKLNSQIDSSTIYVSVTNENSRESNKISVDVLDELISLRPNKNYNNIRIEFNVDKPDVVNVDKLYNNDTVKVYSEEGKLLGQGKSDNSGKASVKLSNNIEKPFDVNSDVTVFVSVTSENKLESSKTEVTQKIPYYLKSRKLYTSNISRYRNVKGGYIVDITGIKANDIIKVYQSSERQGRIETFKSNGSCLTIKLTDQFVISDSVYITIKNENKIESDELEVNLPQR